MQRTDGSEHECPPTTRRASRRQRAPFSDEWGGRMTRFFLPTDTYLRSSGRVPRPRRGRRSRPRRRGLLPRGLPDTPSTHDEGERSQINQLGLQGVEKLRQRAFIPFPKNAPPVFWPSPPPPKAPPPPRPVRAFPRRGRRETDRSRGSGASETGKMNG